MGVNYIIKNNTRGASFLKEMAGRVKIRECKNGKF